eukprot:6184577-Pleurochrysis_carterae.AAC.1
MSWVFAALCVAARACLRATEGLVDHDATVWQRAALALLSGAEQEGAHRGGRAEAHRVHVARHILPGARGDGG